MKIALVILHADTARGGAERYTLDLAAALLKRGHDVSILASSFQSKPFSGRAISVRAEGMTRTGRYLSFLNHLDLVLEGETFDVVHAMLPMRSWYCDIYHPHAGIAAEAVLAGHLNKSGAFRQALSRLGNHFNSRRNRFAEVEGKLLRAEDPPVVLCLSDLIKAVVKRHYPGLLEEKLVSLFNGTDLQKFDPAVRRESRQEVRDRFSITHEEVVGLMLAQDFERKGLRQAIEALANVPGLILLVGGKPDPAKYQHLAKSLGVTDRVIFALQVSDPVAFYQAADFFVLPTRFDPCSLVVLEALAMGLPVISTEKNGACEIMQHGVHGRVLKDPDDVAGLAQSMGDMMNAEDRSRMSAACLALRPKLSQDWHLQRLEAVYAECVKQRPAAFGGLAQR